MDLEQRIAEILKKDSYNVYDLCEIVSILRSEKGCPWDKVQTHETLKKDFLEETYEVLDAIDSSSAEMLREELGDVLLQVVFHADIERDNGSFDLDDVSDEVCKKLILRHPHVFGDVDADTVDKVLTNWDKIKKQEKQQETYTDTLKSVPKNFPALMRAQKLSKRASRAEISLGDTESLCDEIAGAAKAIAQGDRDKLGKLLFMCATLAQTTDLDAEQALMDTNNAFIESFEKLEASGDRLDSKNISELLNNEN